MLAASSRVCGALGCLQMDGLLLFLARQNPWLLGAGAIGLLIALSCCEDWCSPRRRRVTKEDLPPEMAAEFADIEKEMEELEKELAEMEDEWTKNNPEEAAKVGVCDALCLALCQQDALHSWLRNGELRLQRRLPLSANQRMSKERRSGCGSGQDTTESPAPRRLARCDSVVVATQLTPRAVGKPSQQQQQQRRKKTNNHCMLPTPLVADVKRKPPRCIPTTSPYCSPRRLAAWLSRLALRREFRAREMRSVVPSSRRRIITARWRSSSDVTMLVTVQACNLVRSRTSV